VETRLKENRLENYHLMPIEAGDEIKAGIFDIGFIQGSHSIPDACGIYLKTPVGTIVHTGDFKIDPTPVDGKRIDIHKFAQLGKAGVLALLADSTNAEREGHTGSELEVSNTLDQEFSIARGRIIMATFASNVSRLQQAANIACKYGRKIVVCGRSMVNVVNISMDLGYLTIPEGVLIEEDLMHNYEDKQILILTTGSQGEPMAGLSRMANRNHRRITITPGDTILVAATPIPGNARSVGKTIDNLLRLGAHVVYEKESGIHVSGHASRDELQLMLNLVRPKFFLPVHGEYRMLKKHGELAEKLGIPKENILLGENGSVFEFSEDTGCINGKVKVGNIFVDGLGVGDVGNIVIRDRQQLSQDGVLIVVVTLDKESKLVKSGPDLVSRGFVYVRDSEALMHGAQLKIKNVLHNCEVNHISSWTTIKVQIREALNQYLIEKTGRRPMILPIIMEA